MARFFQFHLTRFSVLFLEEIDHFCSRRKFFGVSFTSSAQFTCKNPLSQHTGNCTILLRLKDSSAAFILQGEKERLVANLNSIDFFPLQIVIFQSCLNWKRKKSSKNWSLHRKHCHRCPDNLLRKQWRIMKTHQLHNSSSYSCRLFQMKVYQMQHRSILHFWKDWQKLRERKKKIRKGIFYKKKEEKKLWRKRNPK